MLCKRATAGEGDPDTAQEVARRQLSTFSSSLEDTTGATVPWQGDLGISKFLLLAYLYFLTQ